MMEERYWNVRWLIVVVVVVMEIGHGAAFDEALDR